MTTASMAACNYTSVIATFAPVLSNNKRTLRLTTSNFAEVSYYSSTGAWAIGTESANCHYVSDPLGLRKKFDRVALCQTHHSFLNL